MCDPHDVLNYHVNQAITKGSSPVFLNKAAGDTDFEVFSQTTCKVLGTVYASCIDRAYEIACAVYGNHHTMIGVRQCSQ
jgi:hypothetical protein